MRDEQWTTPGEDMGLVLNRIAGHMECAQRAYSVRQRTADPGKCECFACADFRALRDMISAERTAAQADLASMESLYATAEQERMENEDRLTAAQAEAERLKAQLDAERGKGSDWRKYAKHLDDCAVSNWARMTGMRVSSVPECTCGLLTLSRAGEGEK